MALATTGGGGIVVRGLKKKFTVTEKNEWGDNIGSHYSPETIAEFEKAVKALKLAYVYAQRIDWLLSGDDGEDSFYIRLQAQLGELK
jgi:hypothetical protein